MFHRNVSSGIRWAVLGGIIFGNILLATAFAQTAAPPTNPPAAKHSRYRPDPMPKKAARYYGGYWGVDSLTVKAVESGELIRFSYRVLDPEKARVFNDKNIEPSLVDLQAGVSLVVPQLEKVGKLRNVNTPEAGKSYWMAFSNPGRHVKRGDHVIIVIGHFRADGLVVE